MKVSAEKQNVAGGPGTSQWQCVFKIRNLQESSGNFRKSSRSISIPQRYYTWRYLHHIEFSVKPRSHELLDPGAKQLRQSPGNAQKGAALQTEKCQGHWIPTTCVCCVCRSLAIIPGISLRKKHMGCSWGRIHFFGVWRSV